MLRLAALLLALTAAACLACDTSAGDHPLPLPSPIPAGLTLTATPSVLFLSGGTTTVLASLRTSRGTPVPDTDVSLSTSSGTLSSALLRTNANGDATVTVTGNSAATVLASASGIGGRLDLAAIAPFTISLTQAAASTIAGRSIGMSLAVTKSDLAAPGPSLATLTCGTSAPAAMVLSGATAVGDCVFTSAGTYTVRAAAATTSGWSTSIATAVNVTAAPVETPAPTPTFSVDASLTTSPRTYSVAASHAPSGTVTYRWDFGDDAHDSTILSSVPHTFQVTGEVTINVTARDEHNEVLATARRTIRVN